MFWVSFAFLTILAGLLCSSSIEVASLAQFYHAGVRGISSQSGTQPTRSPVDPRPAAPQPGESSAPAADEDMTPDAMAVASVWRFSAWLGLLYAVIVGEGFVQFLTRGYGWRRHGLYLLVPPLRIGGRDHVDGNSIWLPNLGWRRVDRPLQQRLEKAFNLPMILVALAVLPLVALDHQAQARGAARDWPMMAFLWVGESLIWFAFAFEFLVMFSVAPKKVRYCREHWLDLIIIMVPMIGFLRLFRVARVLRLSRIARAARAYRLRSAGQRMFRSALLINLMRYVIEHDPAKQLARLREELQDREEGLRHLRDEIARIEALLAAQAEADGKCSEKATSDCGQRGRAVIDRRVAQPDG